MCITLCVIYICVLHININIIYISIYTYHCFSISAFLFLNKNALIEKQDQLGAEAAPAPPLLGVDSLSNHMGSQQSGPRKPTNKIQLLDLNNFEQHPFVATRTIERQRRQHRLHQLVVASANVWCCC